MSFQTMFVVLLFFIVLYAMFQCYSLKNKIYCTFRRRDRTKIEKWAKANWNRIEFDGGWYIVQTSGVTLKWITGGIHNFFPVYARCLDYRYDSRYPLNPDTFNNAESSPEETRALDRTSDLQGLYQGHQSSMATTKVKKSFLESIMPIVLIGGVLILGYMLWQLQKRVDMLGQAVNVLQSMMMKK